MVFLKNIKGKKLGRLLAIYGFIAAVSVLSCYLFLLDGLPGQDDIYFHMTQCYDVYYGLKNGFYGLSTNHVAMGAFGYNVYLFYGALPHYLVAFTFLITEWMGSSLIGCYKFIVILSMFVSGVFTYLLALRVSKGNTAIGLVGATLYILFPYRIFCIFWRGAFAESVGMAFIPMLFYGLYRILNDKEFYVAPFVNTILSIVFLVLSHPFTALLSVCFALVYLLCNIKKLIKALKRKPTPLFTVLSLVLVVGLVFFYVIPTFAAKSSGLYVVNDPVRVWTTYEHMASTVVDTNIFAGFFYIPWITTHFNNSLLGDSFTLSYLFISGFIGILSILLSLIADYFIQKAPKSKYYRFLVDLAVLFILPATLYRRVEVLISLGIYYVLFVLIMLLKDAPSPEDDTESKKAFYKNPDVYFLLVSCSVLLIFLYTGWVWKYVPSIFYQGQFAWRIWSLFDFFAVFVAIYLLSYLQYVKWPHKKYIYAIMGTIAISFMSFNEAYLEKRAPYIYDGGYPYTLIDYSFAEGVTSEGSANEYMPLVFAQDDYVPKYSNSLYYPIDYALAYRTNFIHSLEDYNSARYCPRALEGSATVKATKLRTPEVSLDATVTSDNTLIQIPQFYYSGYAAKITDVSSNSSSYAEVVDTDGLVSFKVASAGTYTVEVTYRGTGSYRIGKYIFILSAVGLVALGVGGYYYRKKKEKASLKNS